MLSESIDLICRLPEPVDYFTGLNAKFSLPREVVVFRGNIPSFPQFHGKFVLVVCCAGDGEICLDDKCFKIEEGHGMLFSPFQTHTCLVAENIEPVWAFITFYLDSPRCIAALLNSVFEVTSEDYNELNTLLRQFSSIDGVVDEQTFVLKTMLFMISLCRRHSHSLLDSSDQYSGMEFTHTIGQYIENHMTEPISLSDLAKHMHMSVSNMRRLVSKHMSMPLGKIIRHLRLHKAMTMLDHSDMTVTEIGIACGFMSLYAFSRAFKSALGVAPSVYRQLPLEQRTSFL